jgi:dolichol-phosphate mannosyltransferase
LASIVVATFNERDNIIPLLKQLVKYGDEVIVVDDNSPDGTGLLAKKFDGKVRTIVRPQKMGLNGAIIRGSLEAKCGNIIVMDADLSHPPALIPDIIETLRDRDIVVANRRHVVGWGFTRHAVSKIAGTLAQIAYFRWKVREPMSGFFGIRKAIIEKYYRWVSPKGYKILFTILKHYTHDHGYSRIGSVNYTFINRKVGKSKLSMNVILDYLKSVLTSKSFEDENELA